MKVKNIMFFGFAAAILSAGAASAAATATYDALNVPAAATEATRKIVTSKAYVDTSTNALKADIALIPAAGTGVLTVKRNNTEVGTFNANATENASINIEVPTATSDLNNDSGYITADDVADAQAQADWNQTDTEAADFIKNKPTALAQFSEDATHRVVTDTEKTTWNAKEDSSNKLEAGDTAGGTIAANATDDTKFPTAKNVAQYVASNPGNYITANDVQNAQAQADWNQTNTEAADFIKNKPTALAQFSEDATHRVVTDTEKTTWNAKEDSSNKLEAGDTAGGTIAANATDDTKFPTAKNVAQYVQAVTNGNTIPAQPAACATSGNTCALITNTDGSLQWVVMADDQHAGNANPS